MRARQIADMDIVANARAVGRRIIVAENFELARNPSAASTATFIRCVAALARLSGAATRIGARNVEVAQYDVIGARARFRHRATLFRVINFDQPYGEIGCVGAFSLTGISAGLP